MKFSDFLRKLIPNRIKTKIKRAIIESQWLQNNYISIEEYANIAYSQEGEDRILISLFRMLNKDNGFYVDVGAHHPKRFSNTYNFYLQGWHGINIDADKGAIALFRETRPRDINISIGIGEKAEESIFFVFNEPAFNTFDADIAENTVNHSSYKIIEKRIVEIAPLSQILDDYLPKGQEIDLLSIDVEGRDLEVLKSNDWSKYVPMCILVEIHSGFDQKEGFSFDEVLSNEISQYLQSKGYKVFAKTLNTIFFIFKKYNVKTDLKIFTYDLPVEHRCEQKYLSLASETFYAIFDFFKYNIPTTNPAEADFFFVPLNLIDYQYKNEDPGKIVSELKYLSEKNNHILVATGDFSQRSRKNNYCRAYKKTYNWLNDFILLALESTSDLIPDRDIGIIPFNTLVDIPFFNTNIRTFLYSFLGVIKHELLPKNHVRSQLKYLHNKPDVLITTKLDDPTRKKLKNNYEYVCKDDFELVARNSTFTLSPAGYGKWTYRFFNAIQWGSIPVLFADDYIKPFQKYIPYDSFTITLPEKEILNVDKILRSISPQEIKKYQENIKANQSKFTRSAFFEMLVHEIADLR